MIEFYQGEYKEISVDVIDEDTGELADLTGAVGYFGFGKGQEIIKPCLIDGSTLIVSLTPEETKLMLFRYDYEFKIVDLSGHPSTVKTGELYVHPAQIKEIPTP